MVFKLFIHNKIYKGEYNNDQWWFYLGTYYKEQKDYDNMMKYYLLAISKDNSNAMNNLGVYYYEQKDYDNMMKYYLMALSKNHPKTKQNVNNILQELPYDKLLQIIPYTKYLEKSNIKFLNDKVETQNIECIICYENNEFSFSNCNCQRKLICKRCYSKIMKCVNCQNF